MVNLQYSVRVTFYCYQYQLPDFPMSHKNDDGRYLQLDFAF